MSLTFKKFIFYTGIISLGWLVGSANASPPFITDSPEPTDYQALEMYLFGTVDKTNDGSSVQLPALETDWGFAPDWQFHLVIPFNMNMPKDNSNTAGLGDIETAVTYRFLQDTAHTLQMAIAPAIEWPTGDADKGLGNGHTWVKIPIWAQKSWGSWATYGGGGYALNSADTMRNYSFTGWVIQHDINEKLSLGGEIYTQSAASDDSRSYALLNIGGSYHLSKHFELLPSLGHSIAGENHLVGYLGLHWQS